MNTFLLIYFASLLQFSLLHCHPISHTVIIIIIIIIIVTNEYRYSAVI